MTPRAAADYLEISLASLRRLVKAKKVGFIRHALTGKKWATVRFRQQDLDDYLERCRVSVAVSPLPKNVVRVESRGHAARRREAALREAQKRIGARRGSA